MARDDGRGDVADATIYAFSTAVRKDKADLPDKDRAEMTQTQFPRDRMQGIFERIKGDLAKVEVKPFTVVDSMPASVDDAVFSELIKQTRLDRARREGEIATHIMGKSGLDKAHEENRQLKLELRDAQHQLHVVQDQLNKLNDEEEKLIRRIAAKTQAQHGDQAGLLRGFLVWLLGERGIEFHRSRVVLMRGVTKELREQAGELARQFVAVQKELADDE